MAKYGSYYNLYKGDLPGPTRFPPAPVRVRSFIPLTKLCSQSLIHKVNNVNFNKVKVKLTVMLFLVIMVVGEKL